jgi:hypothetical protein
LAWRHTHKRLLREKTLKDTHCRTSFQQNQTWHDSAIQNQVDIGGDGESFNNAADDVHTVPYASDQRGGIAEADLDYEGYVDDRVSARIATVANQALDGGGDAGCLYAVPYASDTLGAVAPANYIAGSANTVYYEAGDVGATTTADTYAGYEPLPAHISVNASLTQGSVAQGGGSDAGTVYAVPYGSDQLGAITPENNCKGYDHLSVRTVANAPQTEGGGSDGGSVYAVPYASDQLGAITPAATDMVQTPHWHSEATHSTQSSNMDGNHGNVAMGTVIASTPPGISTNAGDNIGVETQNILRGLNLAEFC